jgi:hypothetical protein
MGTTKKKAAQSQATAHQWGQHIRREFDTLVRATEGMGATALVEAIATEAVIADTGELADGRGNKGWAWNPEAIRRTTVSNPAAERVKSAGASLGRVLCGGHPNHRVYLAFLQAIYVVTTQQDYDVAARIEMLWDQMAYENEEAVEELAPRQSWLGRAWQALLAWFRNGKAV